MLLLESIGKVTSAAIYIQTQLLPFEWERICSTFYSELPLLLLEQLNLRPIQKKKQRRRMRHKRHSQVEWVARWSSERGGENGGVRSLSRTHSCEGCTVRWWPLTMTQSTGMWVDASDARYSWLSIDITCAAENSHINFRARHYHINGSRSSP